MAILPKNIFFLPTVLTAKVLTPKEGYIIFNKLSESLLKSVISRQILMELVS